MRRLTAIAASLCLSIASISTPDYIHLAAARVPQLPAARAYSLGDSAIDQTWLPKRDPNRRIPYRLEGVLAMPDGNGPFPVIFVLHDAEGGCFPDRSQQDIVTETWPCLPAEETRSDIGLSYLLSNLAAHGYAAVAPNLNVVYAHAYGAVAAENRRYPSVFDAHLRALSDANASDTPALNQLQSLKGKLDLAHIGIIGHGQGSLLALDTARARTAKPRTRRAPPPQPLIGALLVAPVYAPDGDVDQPLGVILSECDGLVPDASGQAYYEDARQAKDRAHFAASVYVVGANSRYFNNAANSDDAQKVSNVPGCASDTDLLSREAQRSFLAKYAPDFFDASQGRREAMARAGLDAGGTSVTRVYNTPVRTAFAPPTATRLVVVQPRSKDELSNNGAAGFTKAEGAARADMCDSRTSCGRWPVVPANPAMARLSWTSSTSATWTSTLGDRDTPTNLSQFAVLHLRLAPDPSDVLNAERIPLGLRITLTDDRNKTASTTLSAADTPALAYPAGKPDATSFRWLGHSFLSSVRVPLTRFDPIDLSRVTGLKIEPVGGPSGTSGSVFIADLEFLRP